ncbi:hypothetical protein CPB83DRAFT_774909 [Crepidotus variabilis]|uniref:6-phosphogluconate dehydrogenase C-terminal domain-like protein n=1 Tax=Crepidotus variabilis TaxID=179855 RepID=A0A9P6JKA6_9AGAR|nr:hypothetical protein CPB83DRAFT_774909 [Crepidotus variabilis]
MAAPLKEVLLVGFGAVGAIYSLILKRSGLTRVTAVARSNYEIVKDQGVHFRSLKYGNIEGWKPDRLCKSVAEAADREYSYVVITTKAIPELTKTPEILAPLLAKEYREKFKQPTYAILQNGLNVEVDLYNALKEAQPSLKPSILSTAVWIGTNLSTPNTVEHNDFDRVTLGVYRHEDFVTSKNSTDEDALLQDFGRLLEQGGTTLTIVPEIQRKKFLKNFWNVGFASFATLTQYTLPAIFRGPPKENSVSYTPFVSPKTADRISEYTIPALRATFQELVTLGRALGFPDSEEGLSSSTVDFTILNTQALHEKANSRHVPSMLLDLQRGMPIEVEAVLGEVVRMARKRQVDIPRVETLYALLLITQNQILRELENKKSG